MTINYRRWTIKTLARWSNRIKFKWKGKLKSTSLLGGVEGGGWGRMEMKNEGNSIECHIIAIPRILRVSEMRSKYRNAKASNSENCSPPLPPSIGAFNLQMRHLKLLYGTLHHSFHVFLSLYQLCVFIPGCIMSLSRSTRN